VLEPRRIDELVRPDRLAAELGAVGVDALRQEAAAGLGGVERIRDRGCGVVRERGPQLGVDLTSSFIFQSASIESQLRFTTEDWSRPGRPGVDLALTSAIVALRASVPRTGRS